MRSSPHCSPPFLSKKQKCYEEKGSHAKISSPKQTCNKKEKTNKRGMMMKLQVQKVGMLEETWEKWQASSQGGNSYAWVQQAEMGPS